MGNSSFQGSKLEFQSLETNRFTKGNRIVCLSYFFACRLYLN